MASVTLEPYTPDWQRQFAKARTELLLAFAGLAVQVEHIGSTAVPGLTAKPVIDVLLGADSLVAIESRMESLARIGFQYVAKYEQQLPMRRYFVTEPRADRLRIHLHAVVIGSTIWRDHLMFRDALRSDSALLAAYQTLKLELATRFAQDKASYTEAKGPFITNALACLRNAAHASAR